MATPVRIGSTPTSALSLESRLELLDRIPGFAVLPAPIRTKLAGAASEVRIAAGDDAAVQGETGDGVFVVISGHFEILDRGRSTPLALLGAGDLFGELALSGERTRTATVQAVDDGCLLKLDATLLIAALAVVSSARAALEAHSEQLRTARFVRLVAAFDDLDDAQRRSLAAQVQRRSVAAGAILVEQGSDGESCFMIQSGRVEVVVSNDDGECRLAELGPRAMFGEAAILAGGPRAATVRALEDCVLLELSREALRATIESGEVRRKLAGLLRVRDRPRRQEGILAYERQTPEGERITILKDPDRGRYYRLSDEGRFLWDRLDGRHGIKELTLQRLGAFGDFAPDLVVEHITRLTEAGFVIASTFSPALVDTPDRGRWRRIVERAHRALQAQATVAGLDPHLAAAYTHGVRLLFTRGAQVAMAVLACAGIALFAITSGSSATALHRHPWLPALVVPAVAITLFVHEAGHAFTVKAFGREVNRAGIGWYWFTPVAFVDTSDMWLGTRRQRILVSLAGPYATLVLGGAIEVGAQLAPAGTAAAVAWLLSLPIYGSVLLNLNPLLEYDGYYVLSDLLDRPSLRSEALGGFSRSAATLARRRRLERTELFDLAFAMGCLIYIAVMATLTVVIYRATVQKWMGTIAPASVARNLAWVLAVLIGALALLAVSGEVRVGRSSSEGSRA